MRDDYNFVFQILNYFDHSSFKYLEYVDKNQKIKLKKRVKKYKNKGLKNIKTLQSNKNKIYANAIGKIYYNHSLKINSSLKAGEEIAYIKVLNIKIPIIAKNHFKVRHIYFKNGDSVEYDEAILEIENSNINNNG